MPDPTFAAHSRGLLAANLVAQMAFGLLAMTICLPSMQEWGAIFGTDQASVQLSFSAYLVAYGALQLVFGPLSDRHGRRRILLLGLMLTGAASLAGAFAPSIQALVAVRALQGAGAAACMVVGRAAVQDLFHGPERTRVMAYVGMAMGVCPPLGTVLGGQLHARLGWQANFVLLALLALGLLGAALRFLPAQGAAPSAQQHWLREMGRSYAQLARHRVFLLNVMLLAFTVAAFYAFLGAAPLVLGSYGVGPASVGYYIMVPPLSYIGGNFLTSRLVRRRGERGMRAAGQGLTLLGITLMVVLALAGLKTPLAFALPLALLGVGHGLLMPTTLAATVGAIPALAGAAAAVAGVMQQLMGAVAGYTVGWVTHDGPVNLGLVMIGFTLCAVAAQIALQRR